MALFIWFLILNVILGLMQLWAVLFYWALYQSLPLDIEYLVRDGSLLFFATSLIASSTYSLFPNAEVYKHAKNSVLTTAGVANLGLFGCAMIYSMEVGISLSNGKEVHLTGKFFWIQVSLSLFALLYAIYTTYMTDGFRDQNGYAG